MRKKHVVPDSFRSVHEYIDEVYIGEKSPGELPRDGRASHGQCVRIATTAKEKEEIYRLRYKIYIEEMHGENRHIEADRTSQQLRDEWDEDAYQFYIRQEGVIVACGRGNLRRDGPLECEEQFELERFRPWFPNHLCMTSRLALHPKLRGNYLLKKLMCAMYEFGRQENLRYNFIDCHPQLLPMYARLGYRLYRAGFNHHKYTYVLPMVLVLDDREHLERVRSPFHPIALRYSHSTEARELLLTRFPLAGNSRVTVNGDAPAFWNLLRDCLLSPTATVKGLNLLDGLSFEEAKLLVSSGHIVSCRAGDVVLKPADPGREIFLILNGSFQVQRRSVDETDGEGKVMKLLAGGEIFGEIRFLREELRYASVKAREDSTLLVLNAKMLDRLVMTVPRLAAKVFRNLARITAIRTCDRVRFMRSPRLHR